MNLAELQRTRASLGGSNSRQERNRVLKQVQDHGCRSTSSRLATGPKVRDNEAGQPKTQPGQPSQRAGSSNNPKGNLRTMCVRTCDGYFFPISWSVSARAFDRDTFLCANMCPGVEVELYYHRVPHEESDRMVSAATGLPYTQMPFAFRYKRPQLETRAECSCGRPAASAATGGYTIIGGSYGASDTLSELKGSVIAFGSPKLHHQPSERAGEPVLPAMPTVEERTIRVVGPEFLPDQ
ncbi:DUF2865 domain-containing protein [Aquamicrobium sp. cd-1]|uniref:DUF2865 domain-containing protein n=2 Tax=Aquamicrobium zhengzhouense TaxID=2781738 RepID=A0ABS0S8F4_9HYPH|nr:DUF2865 domain-containing protein [Aquamicrobium zhengzhouense]